jgi:hypothetical protein
MTATVYLSAAVAHRAEEIQETHKPDADGWCGFCLRHFRIRVRAGQCKPWQMAEGSINSLKRQQERLCRPKPTVGRVWPT